MGVNLITKHYKKDFDMGYFAFMRLRTAITNFLLANNKEPSPGTLWFLKQYDSEGKLSYKQCKDLLSDISDMPDDGSVYGYNYCQRTLTDFKEILSLAIQYRCNFYWH